jgi:KTSC domain
MAMRKIPFTSTSGNVVDIEFDEDAQDLFVTFKGGKYVAHGVDGNTADGFTQAASAGRYYNEFVRDLYVVERIG